MEANSYKSTVSNKQMVTLGACFVPVAYNDNN
jgi:hypothetical protein